MSTSPTTTEKMELSEEDRRVQGEMELNKVSETLVYIMIMIHKYSSTR